MYSCIHSGTIYGIEGKLISIEADVSEGLPCFTLVGLLASEVKEAGERVKNALKNSGYKLPAKRVTINLSPADIRKAGTGFDVAIAISILCSYGILKNQSVEHMLFLGELGLGGEIKPVKGILPILDAAKVSGISTCIVPFDNLREAELVRECHVLGAKCLVDVIGFLLGNCSLETEQNIFSMNEEDVYYDFADVKGQAALIRGVTVAAAGMHNILIAGPPGSGKSMVAKRIPSILPDLTYNEQLLLTKIYSAAGLLGKNQQLLTKRPFRSPHHTITRYALIGGGSMPKPGEITLAHGGVLFLDEFPEFSKNVIEVLRQPLEDRVITLSRIYGNFCFPADFMMVGAMNLCPCGNYPDIKKCSCSVNVRKRYLSKISRPILDRIDMQILVSPVTYDELYEDNQRVSTKTLKKAISKAHDIQQTRYKSIGILFNSQLEGIYLDRFCRLPDECKEILRIANDRLQMSARANDRVRKIARTIADLEGNEEITKDHLLEALSYRGMEEL